MPLQRRQGRSSVSRGGIVTTHLHTYEPDDADADAVEVRYTYDVRGGRPAQIWGPPERCHPEEDPDIELVEVEIEDRDQHGTYWRIATQDEYARMGAIFDTIDTGILLDENRADQR